VYVALDEVRHNIKMLDGTFSRMSHLFNTVYLSVYIWVQKLKQLGLVDSVMDEREVRIIEVLRNIKIKLFCFLFHLVCNLVIVWNYKSFLIFYSLPKDSLIPISCRRLKV